MSEHLADPFLKKQPSSERCLLVHTLPSRLELILNHIQALNDLPKDDSRFAKHVSLIQEAATQMAEEVADRLCPFCLKQQWISTESITAKPGTYKVG